MHVLDATGVLLEKVSEFFVRVCARVCVCVCVRLCVNLFILTSTPKRQVSQPIREYLCHRSDTIRCLVTLLTDPNEELYEELKNQGEGEGEDGDADAYFEGGDVGEHLDRILKWKPRPPPDAPPMDHAVEDKKMDVIKILVGIYGSKVLSLSLLLSLSPFLFSLSLSLSLSLARARISPSGVVCI